MSKTIVRLKGGLGNQLFIYATGLALSNQMQGSLIIDSRSGFWNDKYKRKYELKKFGVSDRQISLISSILIKFIIRFFFLQKVLRNWICVVNESNFERFAANFATNKNKLFLLNGYFQSEFYFKNVKDNLRTSLTVDLPATSYFKSIRDQITSTTSVCLHGRLMRAFDSNGAKVDESDARVLKESYFSDAINFIRQRVKDPHFFIFSDSPREFTQILSLRDNEFTLIDHEHHQNAVIDFTLMRQCKHFIIPNSSYSWWAAWLASTQTTIIIAPDLIHWDSGNIIPDNWVRL